MLSSFVLNIHEAYGEYKNATSVKKYLKDNYLYFKDKFGINDWRTETLHALSESIEFCDGGFKNIFPIPTSMMR